ncbi:MAG: TAXI family TRAP transporter solute-binding subunit, partial [Deltaproteobacteria bacterium]
ADDVVILEFTDEQLEKVRNAYPVWNRYVIPPGTYPHLDKPVNTIAQPNFLAVRPDLPEETVYLITKTIFENLPFLHNIHKATKAIKLERAVLGLPVPLHPGAVKYYREKGIEIPKELLPN